MVRLIQDLDADLLARSLFNDEYHTQTDPSFFYDNRSVCNVYEDDNGPVMFVRGTKALRIDIQFVDNNATKRNLLIMLREFPAFVEQVRAAGFTELIFNSTSPKLIAFCEKRLGFIKSDGELRKFL